MKKEQKYYLFIRTALIMIFAAGFFAACSKMDDTYKDFIKDGQKIYPGKTDSVQVLSGRERLILRFPVPTDPKVERAKIYWNNRADSVVIPIKGSNSELDSISVPFNDLAEGQYVFEIFTFDKNDNRSVKAEVLARVFGDEYESTLLGRPIDEALFENDTLNVNWGAIPDTTALASEILYTDKEGIEQSLLVPDNISSNRIPNFAPGIIKTRTYYVPVRRALDTFYTPYTSMEIEGPPPPPFFIDKSQWSITPSSEDVKGGRVAANLIDGDIGNMWVNKLGAGLDYPHSVTVDMHETVHDVEGFYFYQRSFNRTKTVEVLTSMDGQNWDSQGSFTMENISGEPIFINLPDATSFRYFKHTYVDDYSGSSNINLLEMGVFTRPVPPVYLDKSDWVISASSEDVAGDRTVENLIDGDLDNLWVNELGAGLSYPHTISVDMDEKIEGIAGFYFYQRGQNNTKTVEVLISQDGNTWESQGEYTIPNRAGGTAVNIEFTEPLSFRYFKHIYLDAYTSSSNINLREMGTFKRK